MDIIGSGEVEVNRENELFSTSNGSAKIFYKDSTSTTTNIEGSEKVINSN